MRCIGYPTSHSNIVELLHPLPFQLAPEPEVQPLQVQTRCHCSESFAIFIFWFRGGPNVRDVNAIWPLSDPSKTVTFCFPEEDCLRRFVMSISICMGSEFCSMPLASLSESEPFRVERYEVLRSSSSGLSSSRCIMRI
jgi:hypothetical protein